MSHGYSAGAEPAAYDLGGPEQHGLLDIGAAWTFDDLPAVDDWVAWNDQAGAAQQGDGFEPEYRNDNSASSTLLTPSLQQSQNQIREEVSSHDQSTASMGTSNSSLHNANNEQRRNLAERFVTEDRHDTFGFDYNHSHTIADINSPISRLQSSSYSSDVSYNAIPLSDDEQLHSATAMAPAIRRSTQLRPRVVDLTDSPQEVGARASATASRPRKRPAPAQEGASHRIKRTRRSSAAASPKSPPEELDLTADDTAESLLQQQQASTIAAQLADDEPSGPVKIGKRTCIICMEHYTNATVTPCGHIYCHECLTQALKHGERNSERGVGNCPMCRKPVSRKKNNHIVPIAFMKRSAFKGKKKANA